MTRASALRVALFVEGGENTLPVRSSRSSLEKIWNDALPAALGLREFSVVIPISKKHLVALDPSNPPMSGAGERLDQLMGRILVRTPFDAAVVAWDLVPAWNPEERYCRWEETLNLYRFLSQRDGLSAPWRAQADRRLRDLENRSAPSARGQPPQLNRHSVLGLCMDPMFEGLLVQDEAAAKRALGLKGSIPAWPSSGWAQPQERRPDTNILAPAVLAAQSVKSKTIVGVRGSWRTNKDGFGEFLLRQLLADEGARPKLLAHSLCRRLAEIGPR